MPQRPASPPTMLAEQNPSARARMAIAPTTMRHCAGFRWLATGIGSSGTLRSRAGGPLLGMPAMVDGLVARPTAWSTTMPAFQTGAQGRIGDTQGLRRRSSTVVTTRSVRGVERAITSSVEGGVVWSVFGIARDMVGSVFGVEGGVAWSGLEIERTAGRSTKGIIRDVARAALGVVKEAGRRINGDEGVVARSVLGVLRVMGWSLFGVVRDGA